MSGKKFFNYYFLELRKQYIFNFFIESIFIYYHIIFIDQIQFFL